MVKGDKKKSSLGKRVLGQGRSLSSQLWIRRQVKDPYVREARRHHYRSRAAYKLLEIQRKYKFLRPNQIIVDLGASPGGWSQVAVSALQKGDQLSGRIVAVDKLPMPPLSGVDFIELDLTSAEASVRLKQEVRGADGVLSDMAASTIGHRQTDHLKTMVLAETAFQCALSLLKEGGFFLVKIFQGQTEIDFVNQLKEVFRSVDYVKPPGSRQESPEMYLLARGFRKPCSPE